MLAVTFVAVHAFTPALTWHGLGARPLCKRAAVVQASDGSLAERVDERWKFLRDNPGSDAAGETQARTLPGLHTPLPVHMRRPHTQ